MVSHNRLKLHFFKNTLFFCYLYPRPAQYFQFCRFLLSLICIPLPLSTWFWYLNVISRNCIPKNYWNCQNAYFFQNFRIYQHLPPFFHISTPPVDILSECFILLWLMYTLPMFILNINTFPGVIWLVNRILCHFMQFLPPSSSIFPHVTWPHFALVPNSCLSAITLWYLNLISCKCFHKNVEKAQKYEF